MDVNKLADLIEHQLLPGLRVESTDPYEPVKVYMLPEPWRVAGTGNYAVVVAHPYYPDWVVKVYAPGRSGWYKEKAVYQRLGQRPSISWYPYASDPYLILKRMKGQTLYDCIKRGIRIPERVILDIDEALEYARSRGLVPQDLHAKVVYGLPICTLRNFYAGVPDEIIEAAKIDGTGFFGVMRYIILPVSITGFVVVGIWQFTNIWNEFLFAVTLTTQKQQPVMVALQNLSGSQIVQWNVQMAGAVIAALPTLLVYIFLSKSFVRGLLAGSIKG